MELWSGGWNYGVEDGALKLGYRKGRGKAEDRND
jgi:hypothetical protein